MFFKSVGVLGGSLGLGRGNPGWIPSLPNNYSLLPFELGVKDYCFLFMIVYLNI